MTRVFLSSLLRIQRRPSGSAGSGSGWVSTCSASTTVVKVADTDPAKADFHWAGRRSPDPPPAGRRQGRLPRLHLAALVFGCCAVATFAATGRFDVRSPNCRIYKTIYAKAVRLEGLRLLTFAAGRSQAAAECGRRITRNHCGTSGVTSSAVTFRTGAIKGAALTKSSMVWPGRIRTLKAIGGPGSMWPIIGIALVGPLGV
jgi:hypothetical protein